MSISRIPGIPYAAVPKAAGAASALAWPPRLLVIHDTGNTASAASEANYAATRTDAQSNWTSAHAYIDASGPLGSCPLSAQAWAAFGYANQHGIHFEMCGKNAGDPSAVPQVTIDHTAALTAQVCALAGIPVVKLSPSDVAAGRSGICGHLDITIGLGVGDHDDPGPAFNWTAFIAAVHSGGSMALTDNEIQRIARNTARLVVSGAYDEWGFTGLGDAVGLEITERAVNPGTGAHTPPNGKLYDVLSKLSSGGALSDADRALLQADIDALNASTSAMSALKASVDSLNSRLASP